MSLAFSSARFQPRFLLVGSAIILAIFALYGSALWSLWATGAETTWANIWDDTYLHRVVAFSFGQALLSASLSILFGGIFARVLFFLPLPGKSLILKLLSLTFVLPALLAIFGLIGIYGKQGWLSQLLVALDIAWRPTIYGLSGIILAHLFFNIPLAARMSLQALNAIPNEQRALAAQLNLRGFSFFRFVEWPYLKNSLLSTFVLIFLLCFSSFTIVLALGGGPQYSTLEVAVYQAIFFEFDLPKAALFALVQFVLGALLFSIPLFLNKTTATQISQRYQWIPPLKRGKVMLGYAIFVPIFGFIALPLMHIVVQGILGKDWAQALSNPDLWYALGYSLTLAPTAAICSLLLATGILLSVRRLQWAQLNKAAELLMNAGMLVLAIPTIVLAVGLFMLLQDYSLEAPALFMLVALCNALAALPFVLRILKTPMWLNLQYYENLCQSLGIRGWARWRLVEYLGLKQPLRYAFALAATLSLGDFTAIALFGNADFTSLPALLYRQIGQYRNDEGAVTAFILLLLCVLLFALIERHESTKETQDD